MPDPVVTATQTVMSGLVLRWRRDPDARVLLSASRDGVMIHGDVWTHDLPGDWLTAAEMACGLIRAGRKDDARSLATHRDSWGGEITPITEGDADA